MRHLCILTFGLLIAFSSAACVLPSGEGDGAATSTSTSRADLPPEIFAETVDVFAPGSDFVERFAPESDEPEIMSRSAVLSADAEVPTEGVSCSSRDMNKDCFCPGGCWRTQTDCGCTGEQTE